MATIAERTYDSTIGAGSRHWSTLVGYLEHLSLWLVVAAYGAVYAVLLVAAGILALSIGEMLPGVAGAAAFFTVGLVIIAAAPTATRVLFTRALDAFDDRRESTGPSARPATTGPTSNRVLVVLDSDDPATTLRAVMGDPATVGAAFHLLVVYPTAEYEARRQARIDAGVSGPYTIDHLAEEARRDAQRVGREYLDSGGVGFEAAGAVGRARDHVSEAVRTNDYGRVYVAERPRPVWRRLLGVGSPSTELVRGLPDPVTVVFAADVLDPAREEADVDVNLPGDSMARRRN